MKEQFYSLIIENPTNSISSVSQATNQGVTSQYGSMKGMT
jgi:hypothetical protein